MAAGATECESHAPAKKHPALITIICVFISAVLSKNGSTSDLAHTMARGPSW
jgi:hypothetical protein